MSNLTLLIVAASIPTSYVVVTNARKEPPIRELTPAEAAMPVQVPKNSGIKFLEADMRQLPKGVSKFP